MNYKKTSSALLLGLGLTNSTLLHSQAVPVSDSLTQQLAECEQHLTANRLLTTKNSDQGTAYHCYQSILAQIPEQPDALMGLNLIAERYHAWTRRAIAEQEWDNAEHYLQRLIKVAPEHPDLNALREHLQQTQAATLLPTCQQHLKAKRLLTGQGGSAYQCYQRILQLDPNNAEAQTGLTAIAQQYVEWSQQKADSDPAEAAFYLQQLAKVNPQHPQLATLSQPLKAHLPADFLTHLPTETPSPATTAQAGRLPVQNLKQWQEPITQLNFIELPTGCFTLGSPASETARYPDEGFYPETCIAQFWLSDTEVTNAHYRLYQAHHTSRHYLGQDLNQDTQPAVYITWAAAQGFANWLTEQHDGQYRFRLPTEAEWEYAARAGTQTAYYWGDELQLACQFANVHDMLSLNDNPFNSWGETEHVPCQDGFIVTAPVKQFFPNQFGLYDMLGNVWEWTCSSNEPEQPLIAAQTCAPLAQTTSETVTRIMKGGAWSFRPRFIRAAARYPEPIANRSHYLGFRLVRE